MTNLFNILLSLWTWVFLLFFTVFYNSLGILVGTPLSLLFDKGSRRILHWLAIYWAKSVIALSPYWKLKVEGKENIEPGKHYVIVSNHSSMLDILVALAGLPLHFKFMAKIELFSIPFLGWHMALAGYVPIKRSSAKSGKEAFQIACDWLGRNVSVLFFPEGTRSEDGKMRTFKTGAFRAAQERGVEILPCVMLGTGDALPKKTYVMKKMTPMKLSIGKPVKLHPEKDLEQQIEPIHQEMSTRLQNLKKNL